MHGIVFEVVICGGLIVSFSALIIRFMNRNLSKNDRGKRAIAKNLLFLSVSALISIFNGVVVPCNINHNPIATVPLSGEIDVEQAVLESSVMHHVIDIWRSLTSLFAPLITIILLKPT